MSYDLFSNNRNRKCSWCFKECEQEIVKTSLFGRSKFQCKKCRNNTLVCMVCSTGMARSYDHGSDRMCFWCAPQTKSAMDDPDNSPYLNVEGYCSWCLKMSELTLYKPSLIGRNSYTCNRCKKKILKCRLCKTGYSRGYASYNDELCAKCDKTIPDWEKEENSALLKKGGWCSWCIEFCDHTLDQKNVMRRNVYTCDNCANRTLFCVKCKKAMTRGGIGWDDNLCITCYSPNINWEDLRMLRHEYSNTQATQEKTIENLSRFSKYRQKAEICGMIRPFLLLVSMAPPLRNKIANELGWCIYTEDYIGDPHREAWEIIHAHSTGIQARTNKSYEKVNPFGDNCNWYEILFRVAEKAFGNFMDAQHLDHELSHIVSTEPASNQMEGLEEEFIERLSIKMNIELNTADGCDAEQIRDKTGFTREAAVNYSVSLGTSILHLPSRLDIALYAARHASAVIPSLAKVLVPVSSALATAATPLFIVGVLSLAKAGVDLGLGDTLGRLFVPIVIMLNQRIILMLEEIDINDYMTVDRDIKLNDFVEVDEVDDREILNFEIKDFE
eukprot:TRINITY_DN1234_c0_g1_i3.p1 TRINITY_DN1234_c0_g1~~TRINITY_DN1234_c0_g1_i3.p1  ORF type:complete len:556 (-),score=93.85 TRINITY_DN1234_c0_g1_i3:44-1711(-)